MSDLSELIRNSEADLASRIKYYAEKTGYTKYTPTDENVWRLSVRGLSEGILSSLKGSPEIPELSPDIDLVNDKITVFGVNQAKQHRSRGVTLEMFLGLMKYFRQSYHDIISDHASSNPDVLRAHTFVERYFDKIELGFISEWERSAAELKAHHEKLLLDKNSELSLANGQLKQENVERKRAEQQLNKLNIALERMVEVRTHQLQRIYEQNNYKLNELLILNRLSSINLSKIRLNRLTSIILEALTSNQTLFFDRAMLFLLNERTQFLQGMLGIVRAKDAVAIREYAEDSWFSLDREMLAESDSHLNEELRGCRIELKKCRGSFYRAVTEKKVIAQNSTLAGDMEAPGLFSRLKIGSYAVMPIVRKNGVFGVVVVDNPLSAKKISRNDLKFLQLFSSHASIAIENLMLYNTLEDANRKLQETQEQLVHGERLATIGEMAASIAHELKGPMVAIGGFARRLAKNIPQDTIEAGYVSTIINEELRLEAMLDDILSFSKKTTICYDRCSVIEIVENSLDILSHTFEKNRVTLTKSFPRKAPILYADCHQLKQVFINLFQNSLDVMRDGGNLRVAIASTTLGNGSAVAIKIADTGGGIPDNLKNNLFTPFFTTKASGTGLGLPIANRIVSNHNGKIKVRNHSGGGAEFTVTLPCQD
ncbi:MAG: histidine kinase [Deltaproteobacteria bacterium HGW-Deltaproteobacteria-23]|nr:MAG: histidine kinase [Deltaproteobacteria bacterium HGW-Deltaproteobacteria-23]